MAPDKQQNPAKPASVHDEARDSGDFRFSSRTLILSPLEWLAVIAVVLLAIMTLPRLWPWLDNFSPTEDYRFPYELSNDYWLVARWLNHAAAEYPCLILGDSVVWGQYSRHDETLAAQLNRQLQAPEFANIGLDGLHPAAMYGLMRYYGTGVRNKKILIQLNPLWMSSTRHDLTIEEEVRFNHPQLIPQAFPRLAAYRPTTEERAFAVLERHFDFFAWARHLRLAYFENLDFHSWAANNPEQNPFGFIRADLPDGDEAPRSRPIPWQQARLPIADLPWIDVESSFQWQSFQKMTDLLRQRGNSLFVLVGPFNTHMLSDVSRERYQHLEDQLTTWLRGQNIPFTDKITLPSDEFGDASHPLADGYARIASALLKDPEFIDWLQSP